MKKLILSTCFTALLTVIGTISFAQSEKNRDKTEDIIIRKEGGKDAKITININGNEILVNGKPLSEYKEDGITINKIRGNLYNSFRFAPRAGNSFQAWGESEGKKKAVLGVITKEDVSGAKITEVTEKSAAEKAGLKQGDIIISVDSKKISNPSDLANAINSFIPKDVVTIHYERNGKSFDTKATLGSATQNFFGGPGFNNADWGNRLKTFRFNYEVPRISGETLNIFNLTGNNRLGIRIEDLDEGDGVKITHVEENSNAEKSGLKKDDLVTQIDGKMIKNVNDARMYFHDLKEKSNYTMKVKRNGLESTVVVKIPRRKNNADL